MQRGGRGGQWNWGIPIALILLLVCFHTLITTTAAAQRVQRVQLEIGFLGLCAPLLSTALAQRPHLLLLRLALPLSLSSSLSAPAAGLPRRGYPALTDRISRSQFSLCGRLIIILYAHVPPLWSYYDQ